MGQVWNYLQRYFHLVNIYHVFINRGREKEPHGSGKSTQKDTAPSSSWGEGAAHTTKQFSDTIWGSYKSTQFWHYAPRDGVRFHRLRVVSGASDSKPGLKSQRILTMDLEVYCRQKKGGVLQKVTSQDDLFLHVSRSWWVANTQGMELV